jgi:glycosyltransferase involved in cell wall biosynthesis
MYPSAESPASGVFIEQQVNGLVSLGLQVRVLLLDRRREGSRVYYRLAPKLRNEIAEFAPDLVHVMYGGVMAEQVITQGGLPPVVVTFHGSDLLGENFSGLRRKLISRYGVYCSRKAARMAQAVVVVANHLLNKLGVGVSREKVRVSPCGIDLDRFTPMDQRSCRERIGWQAENFHVLFATSAGDPVKRPELARAAVAEFGAKYGPVQLHVLSAVPNAEVPLWLNASDALLLTSRHEGSPTIVKESLACGLPVVSVNVGDVAERIEGIEGCYLADAETDDLVRKLRLVQGRRQRLSCRANLQDLSCEAVAAKLEQLYREVVRPCPNPKEDRVAKSKQSSRLRACSTFGLLSVLGRK